MIKNRWRVIPPPVFSRCVPNARFGTNIDTKQVYFFWYSMGANKKSGKEGAFMANKKNGGGKNPYVGNSGKPVVSSNINKTTNTITIKTPKG